MLEGFTYTEKQKEYIRKANHRWNIAEGAVRSGKSHVALHHVIPNRVMAGHGKKGLNFLLGVSLGNIERNVLSPMRDCFGEQLVGSIRTSENKALLFGEDVYCLGADSKRAIQRLQGSEIKFVYCDEMANINPDVFEMLKSRLSLPYSECHGACNPEGSRHWLKKFIDRDDLDIFRQHYTIFDNPYLDDVVVDEMVKEYAGTVYYKRLIQGLWVQAEGLVYAPYVNGELVEDCEATAKDVCFISIDYGILNPFAALLWKVKDGVAYCCDEYYWDGRRQGQLTDRQHLDNLLKWANNRYIDMVVIDPSASSFIAEVRHSSPWSIVGGDNKVNEGIASTCVAMGAGCIKIAPRCKALQSELELYVWDESSVTDRVIKDNDHAMDAMRYFVNTIGVKVLKCFE